MRHDKVNRFRRRTLEYMLSTKFEPDEVKRSERFSAVVGGLGQIAFIAGPILYFDGLRYEVFVLLGCGALAALASVFWYLSSSGNRAMRDLHDYIDFEKMKSDCQEHNN